MFRSVKTRITAIFVVAVLVFSGLAGYFGYQYLRWSEHRLSDEMGRGAADTCAAFYGYYVETNADLVPGSDDYEECREELRNVCRQSLMDYMYVYSVNPDDGTITYLMGVGSDDASNQKMQAERGYGTTIAHSLTDLERKALDDSISKEAVVVENDFGSVLTWFSKVDGTEVPTLAAADYSIADQRARVLHTTFLVLDPLIGGLLLVFAIQMHELNKHVFAPVRAISNRMRSFSPSDSAQFESLGITTNDEMGEIAGSFEGMAHKISEYLGDIDKLTAQRLQAGVELGVARRIQRGIVPVLTQRAAPGLDICAFSHPARVVGGDFYQVVERKDGTTALVVGDVSGKGIAAAVFMGLVLSMTREGIAEDRGPKETLERVNEALASTNPEGLFVSVFAGVYDPRTGRLTFCNAGHMPPLVVGRDVRRLRVDSGELIGLYDDIELVEESMALAPGESLLVFTDGANEATNDADEFMGMERFVGALEAHLPYASATELAEEAVWAVKVFAGGHDQFDDLTIAAIRRNDEPGASGKEAADGLVEVAASMQALDVTKELVFALSCDKRLKRRIILACEELVSNVASYGEAAHMWVGVTCDDGVVEVTLADDGRVFDPLAYESGERDFDDLDEGGMGIDLARSLAQSVTYDREADKNVLRLTFGD